MLNTLFIILCGMLLFIPQLSIRFSFFGFPLEIGFLTVLIIYVGFTYSFFRGLIAVSLLSFVAETFSLVPHGYLIVANVILFIAIQVLLDQLLSEAYVTKSLWVFLYSLLSQILTGFVLNAETVFLTSSFFWITALIQSGLNGLLSFPLFILLDFLYDGWQTLFSRRRAHLTGADFYQVKSKQRKYF